jgi:predicted  nucleic acid-binding Zn-ribbon protein
MNFRFMVCVFLLGGSTTLALCQEQQKQPQANRPSQFENEPPLRATLDRTDRERVAEERLRKQSEWLRKQSKDLLDIIKILYNGREAELKELEEAQATMTPKDQMEHRIALIKATLSEKAAK